MFNLDIHYNMPDYQRKNQFFKIANVYWEVNHRKTDAEEKHNYRTWDRQQRPIEVREGEQG